MVGRLAQRLLRLVLPILKSSCILESECVSCLQAIKLVVIIMQIQNTVDLLIFEP
jgi:hypothetical protein